MSHRRIALIVLLALATVPLAARQDVWQVAGRQGVPTTQLPGQAQAPQAEPRGSILGTVVSTTTGQPVDRVRLRLTGSELRGTRTVYSDDDGRFAFIDLPAGSFNLAASKTGYVGVSYGQDRPNAGRSGTPIALAPGQKLDDLAFELPPGGVITGIVFDEKGRPSVATPVRVLRRSLSNGEPSFASAGTGTTDDRGIYRIYGLAPGDYLVAAMPRNINATQAVEAAVMLAEERAAEAASLSGDLTMIRNFSFQASVPTEGDDSSIGYAPVYYPGTLDNANATTVTVDVSQERQSVDFGLQQVPLSTVKGQVIVPPDLSLSSITVRLFNTAEQVPGVGRLSGRVRNGEFTIPGVPPGNYRAVATANIRNNRPRQVTTSDGQVVSVSSSSNVGRMWASADVPISGNHVNDVLLIMVPGMTVSGRIAFEGASTERPRRVRVTIAPSGQAASAAGASSRNATVDENGEFSITGVVPAQYQVRASGASGWYLKSAMYGGFDTLDGVLDVTGTDDVSGLQLTFSDRRTELRGVLQDAMGAPTSEYTVVVFPVDSRYWVPRSRRIQSARPSTTGQFTFSGLPAGQYRLAAVFDVEPGVWYDPAFLQQLMGNSVAVQLQPGQQATQTLRVR